MRGLESGEFTLLGSMSKALGCNGGFMAGRKEIIGNVRASAPANGSALPPPPIAAACLEGLRVLQSEPELRARMQENAKRMRAILSEQDIGVVTDEAWRTKGDSE